MNEMPEVLNDFRVYESGSNDLKGVVDAQLPSLEPMTETVKGTGVAGEYETPVAGQYKSMTLQLKFQTPTEYMFKLAAPKIHAIDLRGAIQVNDEANGTLKTIPIRVAVRCTPKKSEPGKFAKGSGTDTSKEFEVTYLKVTYNGTDIWEIDKINYICIIDGVNYLAEVKKALGL